jgi:hypothetical protein
VVAEKLKDLRKSGCSGEANLGANPPGGMEITGAVISREDHERGEIANTNSRTIKEKSTDEHRDDIIIIVTQVTFQVDEDLVARAKALATAEHMSIDEMVERLLRAVTDAKSEQSAASAARLASRPS